MILAWACPFKVLIKYMAVSSLSFALHTNQDNFEEIWTLIWLNFFLLD